MSAGTRVLPSSTVQNPSFPTENFYCCSFKVEVSKTIAGVTDSRRQGRRESESGIQVCDSSSQFNLGNRSARPWRIDDQTTLWFPLPGPGSPFLLLTSAWNLQPRPTAYRATMQAGVMGVLREDCAQSNVLSSPPWLPLLPTSPTLLVFLLQNKFQYHNLEVFGGRKMSRSTNADLIHLTFLLPRTINVSQLKMTAKMARNYLCASIFRVEPYFRVKFHFQEDSDL